MHALTILDHPNPTSFSAAVARHFIAGVKAAGHSTEMADLHAEGFDPLWTKADIRGDDGVLTPPDVLNEQARIPKRWVVERTFAWLNRCRRLAKDWEKSIESSKAWILIAHIRTLTGRVARCCNHV